VGRGVLTKTAGSAASTDPGEHGVQGRTVRGKRQAVSRRTLQREPTTAYGDRDGFPPLLSTLNLQLKTGFRPRETWNRFLTLRALGRTLPLLIRGRTGFDLKIPLPTACRGRSVGLVKPRVKTLIANEELALAA
jgi:hypothetical protein